MLSAALLAAAIPAGLLLVFAGFTAARAFSVFGPPVITVPCGGGAAGCNTCAVPAGAAAKKAA